MSASSNLIATIVISTSLREMEVGLFTVITRNGSQSVLCHCEVASEKQIVLWTFAAKECAVAGTDDSDVANSMSLSL